MGTLRPNADITTAGWRDHDGGTTDLWQAIGEEPRDDATFVEAGPTTITGVVVYLTDDQRYDDFFATMGSGPRAGQRVMEHVLTEIRDVGVEFTQHRIDWAVCVPGRAAFLTGLFSYNHHMSQGSATTDYYRYYRQGFKTSPPGGGTNRWFGPWEEEVAGPREAGDDHEYTSGSLANWLKDVSAGAIKTCFVGKWTNGYAKAANVGGVVYDHTTSPEITQRYVPPDWDYWAAVIGDESSYDGGSQDRYNVRLNVNGTEVQYSYDPALRPEEYETHVLRTHVETFLDSLAPGEPFVIVVCPTGPHEGQNQNVETEAPYIDVVDEAQYARYGGVSGAIAPTTIGANITTARRDNWADRQEMLASVDDMIAELDTKLSQLGRRGTTAVLFTSDNGMQQGEQEAREGSSVWDFTTGKGRVWDGSVLAPMFIRHPSWQAAQYHFPTWICDLPMTVLDLLADLYPAAAAHHAHTKRDGRSLVRERADGGTGRATFAKGDYLGVSNAGEAIVAENGGTLWKLTREVAAPSNVLLFDLDSDSGEVTDVAAGNGAVVTTLAARLDQLRTGTWNGSANTARTA